MLETNRLQLRVYQPEDVDALYEIFSDPETMQYYPNPFTYDQTKRWITWNQENVQKFGFGLWAVILRETNEFLGDCGITMQNIDGEILPEIGYHIRKQDWHNGYAKEAASAVRDWAFTHTEFPCLYAYMKYTNVASISTAISIGMKKVNEYPDEKNTKTVVYAISREEWQLRKEAPVNK